MICILVLLCALFPGLALAGEPDAEFWKAYALSYPQTAIKAVTAPLEWETGNWLTAGGVVLVTGILYSYDEELRDLFQRNRTDWGDGVMTGFKQFGEGKYVLPAIGATVLGAWLAGSDKTMDTGLLCLKSYLLANGVTQGLKFSTQRLRPEAEQGKEFWNSSSLSFDRSFPSGHTTIVWSVAPILAHQYKDSGWVGPTVYTIGALTSYSRLNDNRHWASDVFFGAVVGYVTARLVLEDTPRLAVAPDPALKGISVRYEF
ncbi:MAG: phosphatase PAP2 family protein [Candidatus Syntrophosphaera sp.]|nr:phosphatase PAP2 family protein [Candidatus Syntrophosphaera sp.]